STQHCSTSAEGTAYCCRTASKHWRATSAASLCDCWYECPHQCRPGKACRANHDNRDNQRYEVIPAFTTEPEHHAVQQGANRLEDDRRDHQRNQVRKSRFSNLRKRQGCKQWRKACRNRKKQSTNSQRNNLHNRACEGNTGESQHKNRPGHRLIEFCCP